MEKELKAFIKKNYQRKYGSLKDFEKNYQLYVSLPIFKANENIHEKLTDYSQTREELADIEKKYVNDKQQLKDEVHWIMRMATQYYLIKAFEAMKINMDDENIRENALGKGTPGRIAKMWCGDNPEDITELGSGRWNKQPYVSCFPNTNNNHDIITKEVEIVSNCSHHFLPFTSLFGGKAVISYIPQDYILGISKLQRLVSWASRRFWLQEDLTQYIGETIKRISGSNDVYVRLENIKHGCETFRGIESQQGSLTTEFKSGIFNK